MGDIIIKKIFPTSIDGVSHAPYTLHIRNLDSLSIELDSPINVLPLPEDKDTDAIGMKIVGNSTIVNVSWIIADEPSDVVEEVSGTATADEQMAFILDDFQSFGIDHIYELKLMPNTGSTPFYFRTGAISKIIVTKSGSTPVTYNATITFMIANMVIQDSLEEASS